jgi:Tol biopolymer transport system component
MGETISHNSIKVVFVDGLDDDVEIFRIQADGSGFIKLTDNDVEDFNPVWSPDGEKIVYGSGEFREYQLYVMNEAGSVHERIGSDLTTIKEGFSWSPDSKKIAITGWEGEFIEGQVNYGNIYIVDIEEDKLVNISKPFDLSGTSLYPDWSADGKWIAFTAAQDRNAVFHSIYTINIDNINERYSPFISASIDIYPHWHPNSEKLLFIGSPRSLFTMNKDGSERVQLASSESVGDGAWSPDGQMIAYEERIDDSSYNIKEFKLHILDIDRGVDRVIFGGEGIIYQHKWTMDSRKIVFVFKPFLSEKNNIYIIDICTEEINMIVADVERTWIDISSVGK